MNKTITLNPSRIGCPSIPGTMMGMMRSINGVIDVAIHYEERSLDVTYDDEKTSPEAIIKKIGEEMGLALEVRQTGAKQVGSNAETCPM